MDKQMLIDVREVACEGLKGMLIQAKRSREGMSPSTMSGLQMLMDTIEKTYKTQMLMEQGGGSYGSTGRWTAGGEYGRGTAYGEADAYEAGRYGRADGMSGEYRERGTYGRDESLSRMRALLEDNIRAARNDTERAALSKLMRQIDDM